MNQPSLFVDPVWTDRYHVGQRITDGRRRPGTVTAISDDSPGGLGGRGLLVTFDNGHVCNFGYDHTISDLPLEGSDALAGVLPAGAIPGDGPPARTGTPTGETQRPPAAAAKAARQSTNRNRR